MAAKKILYVIAPENFRDEEFFVPSEAFQAKGWTVTTVSPRVGQATGMLGGHFNVTQVLDETLQASPFDALVIAGGSGSPEWLWNNTTLHQLAQDFVAQQKPVSAICLSGVVLAHAGLLSGKKATVWSMPESLAAYEKHQVTFVDTAVVTDGLCITANGPEASEAFAKAIETAVLSNSPVSSV